MRMRGLEPPRPERHTDLNRARLPIPPHPRAPDSVAAVGPRPSRIARSGDGALKLADVAREVALRVGQAAVALVRALRRAARASRPAAPAPHPAAPPSTKLVGLPLELDRTLLELELALLGPLGAQQELALERRRGLPPRGDVLRAPRRSPWLLRVSTASARTPLRASSATPRGCSSSAISANASCDARPWPARSRSARSACERTAPPRRQARPRDRRARDSSFASLAFGTRLACGDGSARS